MLEIEKAFESTSSILLGKGLRPLGDYVPWLLARIGEEMEFKSAISEREVYAAPLRYFKEIAGTRIVALDESLELGKKHASGEDVEKLSLSNAAATLSEISCTSTQIAIGQNLKVEKCAGYVNSQFCFKSTYSTECKYAAYSFWPRQSEYVFGSESLMSSKFCIKCYNSENLTRCFEVSDSNACSDCYFSYNGENLRDCMFCFNVKGLKYAIGNVEVGREKYMEIKKMVLAEIALQLEKNKKLGFDIYSIGC